MSEGVNDAASGGAHPGAASSSGLCARHGERPSAARCSRCGDNLCASCASERVDGVCRSCMDLLSSRGKVPHVEWLAVVMMVHGALLSAYALLLIVYGVVFGATLGTALPTPLPGEDGPPPELMAGIVTGTVLFMMLGQLLPGLLQLFGGWYLRQFKYRPLAIAALVGGLASILGCYCFPTSLAIGIWGAIVLLDRDVSARFSAARTR